MLSQNDIRHAVDMQKRSYRLLRWMAKAIEDGFIEFETAHSYATLPEAAEAWILRHSPPDARVPKDALSDFCAFFSTYLENSFDIVANPSPQSYSRDRCYCPMCRWLANAPNLKAKKIGPADKRNARKLKESTIRALAAEHDVVLADDQVDAIVDDPDLREPIALVTYGHDLLRRIKGLATGPEVLALWRDFAWTDTGSPKREFQLTADAILEGEKIVSDAVLAHAQPRH